MGQGPQLVVLEGPAQLRQEVLQGDALGEGQARTASDMRGGVPPTQPPHPDKSAGNQRPTSDQQVLGGRGDGTLTHPGWAHLKPSALGPAILPPGGGGSSPRGQPTATENVGEDAGLSGAAEAGGTPSAGPQGGLCFPVTTPST